MQLPSIEECKACLEYINKGLAVYDLQPVETLEYDECEPGQGMGCLSAYHLAAAVGGVAGQLFFHKVPQADELAEALGTQVGGPETVKIPQEILAVTNPFDELAEYPEDSDTYKSLNAALRDRLVEAGVVEPS